ncbi:sterol esterase 2 [Diplogelasinospora grovesii]|uniref:Sterol esterase 2 n=1 Tax=Diplogelasinospora grovesii TaxID=303347 RepID=A0AAN6S7K7_9PEZI|nr:sterol esterase 2 [Diplogelasinospora grovesii]
METHDAGHPRGRRSSSMSEHNSSLEKSAIEFAQQAEKLSHHKPSQDGDGDTGDVAVEAQFVTPHDPIILTSDGHRLPGVPLEEAHRLNMLKKELDESREAIRIQIMEKESHNTTSASSPSDISVDDSSSSEASEEQDTVITLSGKRVQKSAEGSLKKAMPPSHTNPLFPPLPLYGPPSVLRDIQCKIFQVSSFFLSLAFLGVIVLGALFTSIPPFFYRQWLRFTFRDPDASRPFIEEEKRREELRKEKQRTWRRRRRSSSNIHQQEDKEKDNLADADGYIPTEGGPDPIVCDVGHYARRVGLDVEEFQVQTEDGFIIDLWHVYDPKEYTPLSEEDRRHRGPELFSDETRRQRPRRSDQKPKFPVLLMHGLLQSSGAYCVNDDDSLAFFLCKSGYDVWLGNNRCGFKPKHVLLEYSDPRMWCWNIRQMGVFDLPALTSRVLCETGFEKIGLICHSQGTTQTFVALAKEQRPDLGEKLTVFCALAPAAYAGPLIGKMYFKFMRVITPAMFRLMFGIHAFIPTMMTMHSLLNPRVYGWLGYKVFSFLFDWTDNRWDRGLRDRMFRFAPVYVSAESMRWWLGRECFAKHKCILATKEEWRAEEREDRLFEQNERSDKSGKEDEDKILEKADRDMHSSKDVQKSEHEAAVMNKRRPKGSTAWYNHQAPPFALWVCGNDRLVDGDKLLRRFQRGREPHVNVVHSKVLPEYEHLDVIWAMDAVDQVFKEIREVLWKTCNVRDSVRVPRGCENVPEWNPPRPKEGGGDNDSGNDDSESGSDGMQSSSSEDLIA